ncbi:unnamed protein product [Tenebrio molitor]|nr:unnamed protein product [Tenebrio molitor]
MKRVTFVINLTKFELPEFIYNSPEMLRSSVGFPTDRRVFYFC